MWTKTHLITLFPSLLIYLIIAIGLRFWLINKDKKIKMIPVHIITILLIGLEITKQIKSIINGYKLNDLPLYYCSLFLYIYLALSLYKGKHRDSITIQAVVAGLTLLGVMVIMPSIVYSEGAIKNMFHDFDDFHTVAYHNIVLLGTFIIISLKLFNFNFKNDLLITIVFYISYCVIAAPIAILLKENFNQFDHNTVTAIENIRLSLIEKLGYSWGQSIYALLDTLTTVGFSTIMFILFFLLSKLCSKSFKKNQNNNNSNITT